MRILISFIMNNDPRPHRMIITDKHVHSPEARELDGLGADSWRNVQMSQPVREWVIVRALCMSQMTPVQRIECPTMLHPTGVVWSADLVTIDIGKVSP